MDLFNKIIDLFIEHDLLTNSPERQEGLSHDLQALLAPPVIAVIGKRGVGKSSTLNKLFQPDPLLPVGHVKRGNNDVIKRTLNLKEKDKDFSKVQILDFPGLGESLQADEMFIPKYKKHLPACDVILWVVKADDGALASEQRYMRDILNDNLRSKLVIGINQVDIIQPGKWATESDDVSNSKGEPDGEQLRSIEDKKEAISEIFRYIGIENKKIVAYSANKEWNLIELFDAMMHMCPVNRRFMLGKTENLPIPAFNA